MRYHDGNNMMEGNSYASFYKDDDSKDLPFAEDECELHPQDAFRGSNRSLDSTSHGSSEDRLISQFNASIGSKSADRSIACFYLEMCQNDIHAAVDLYNEQNSEAQWDDRKPYPTPPPAVARGSRRQRPRIQSFDSSHNTEYTDLRHRRNRSFDAAEAPRVTYPSIYRSDHSRYPRTSGSPPRSAIRNRSAPGRDSQSCSAPVSRNSKGGAQFSHRRATQCVVQPMPNRRDAPWGRSKSERYFQDPMAARPQRHSVSPPRGTARSVSPMRSSDSKVYQMQYHSTDYTEAPRVTSARPAPLQNYKQRSRSWEPPSRSFAHYNPAA